jgi:hypothetical protein
MVSGVVVLMLLSSGGNLLIDRSEAESPVKESQEKEAKSVEVYVRHSKSRKVKPCTVTSQTVAIPPKCCYQRNCFVQGHLLESGLAKPLLC